MPPGPDRRQRHFSTMWDMVLESQGVQGTLRISVPCPIVVTGGSNLPEGEELVGLFTYSLVSGHWRVQTRVSRIGEEETVTTAGVRGGGFSEIGYHAQKPPRAKFKKGGGFGGGGIRGFFAPRKRPPGPPNPPPQ